MASTDLVLACHAEATCDVAGIIGGPRGCTGLTARGTRQAERLATRLAAEHRCRRFDAVYTSPRRRAADTATIIAGVLALPATVAEPLRDLDPGDADGRPRHDVEAAFLGAPPDSPDQPYAAGAETWNQYLRRATGVLHAIARRHRGQRVLVVGHPDTITACHVLLLAVAPDARLGLRFHTDPTGLTWWRREVDPVGRAVWILAAHNDLAHLRGEPTAPS